MRLENYEELKRANKIDEKVKSKLSVIMQELENNPNAIIIDVVNIEPHYSRNYLDVFVAPKEGLCTPHELNQFMDALVANAKPEHKRVSEFDPPELGVNVHSINYGNLFYSPEKIVIRPYPNEKIARDVLHGKLHYVPYSFRIGLEKLSEYQPDSMKEKYDKLCREGGIQRYRLKEAAAKEEPHPPNKEGKDILGKILGKLRQEPPSYFGIPSG